MKYVTRISVETCATSSDMHVLAWVGFGAKWIKEVEDALALLNFTDAEKKADKVESCGPFYYVRLDYNGTQIVHEAALESEILKSPEFHMPNLVKKRVEKFFDSGDPSFDYEDGNTLVRIVKNVYPEFE